MAPEPNEKVSGFDALSAKEYGELADPSPSQGAELKIEFKLAWPTPVNESHSLLSLARVAAGRGTAAFPLKPVVEPDISASSAERRFVVTIGVETVTSVVVVAERLPSLAVKVI